jgi:hypothetical protein
MRKGWILAILLVAGIMFPLGVGQARVEEREASAMSYQMRYPVVHIDGKPEVQKKINTDLEEFIHDFQKDYEKGKFFEGNFSYKVQYEDDEVISLTLMDYRFQEGGAHGYTYTRGVNYSKKTGRRLPLSSYVKLRPEDKNLILRQPIYNGQQQRVSLNKTFVTDPIGRKSTKITDNYCLAGNGTIALIYPPYELAPYYMGTLYIHLSPKIVDYLNRKNH